MNPRAIVVSTLAIALFAGAAGAQPPSRPLSPDGSAAAQVLGKWVKQEKGGEKYVDGKWIDITYGRPLKRDRPDLWGSGAEYGKAVLAGAPIWRAGANVSTRLKTEAALRIGDKVVPPGEYSLFVDLKPDHWTLVVSSWPAQQKYDKDDKTALWGAYGYTPDKDVVRVPMKLETLPHSVDELTWAFLDMKEKGGTLALMWDTQLASVPFEAVEK